MASAFDAMRLSIQLRQTLEENLLYREENHNLRLEIAKLKQEIDSGVKDNTCNHGFVDITPAGLEKIIGTLKECITPTTEVRIVHKIDDLLNWLEDIL